jgi:hypothetical protein
LDEGDVLTGNGRETRRHSVEIRVRMANIGTKRRFAFEGLYEIRVGAVADGDQLQTED